MSYKLAVASSDGKNVDLSFGEADTFIIYEVDDSKGYSIIEKRKWNNENSGSGAEFCKQNTGCGNGAGCNASGCGRGDNIPKLELVQDCRCILCKKIGFKVRKQLEKKAITAFDIEYPIDEALEKIIFYFDRIDNHISLRDTAKRI